MVNETLEADRAYQKAIAEAKQEAKRQAIESSDCIDRRAVIDIALQYCPDDDGVCSKAGHDPREMLDEIEQLPPVQPQRTGKCMWCERLKERNLRIEYYWIDEEGCTASFSEPHIVATGIAKFCPNCGAKMEGTNNDT